MHGICVSMHLIVEKATAFWTSGTEPLHTKFFHFLFPVNTSRDRRRTSCGQLCIFQISVYNTWQLGGGEGKLSVHFNITSTVPCEQKCASSKFLESYFSQQLLGKNSQLILLVSWHALVTCTGQLWHTLMVYPAQEVKCLENIALLVIVVNTVSRSNSPSSFLLPIVYFFLSFPFGCTLHLAVVKVSAVPVVPSFLSAATAGLH